MDQLHGTDLGCSTHGSGGEGCHQQVPHVVLGGQTSLHLADDVHHVRVPLDHHQILHRHSAGLTDPAEVIAAEVHQHHVLGAFLGVGQQIQLQVAILMGCRAARTGAGNGSEAGSDALRRRVGLHHHLRTRSDQLPVPEVEEGHVGRWIDHPQAAIELQRLLGNNRLQALADHQLEDVTGGDVFPGGVDRRLEALLAAVALHIGKLLGLRIPGQGIHQGERGFHAPPERCNPRHRPVPGSIF